VVVDEEAEKKELEWPVLVSKEVAVVVEFGLTSRALSTRGRGPAVDEPPDPDPSPPFSIRATRPSFPVRVDVELDPRGNNGISNPIPPCPISDEPKLSIKLDVGI